MYYMSPVPWQSPAAATCPAFLPRCVETALRLRPLETRNAVDWIFLLNL